MAPQIKVEGNGDEENPLFIQPTPGPAQQAVTAGSSDETPIDLEELPDRVWLNTLREKVNEDEVFPVIRKAYSQTMHAIRNLIFERDKQDRTLRGRIRAAAQEINSEDCDQEYFLKNTATRWPNLMSQARKVLEGEVSRAENMVGEFVDPADKSDFEKIQERREERLEMMEKHIEKGRKLVAELRKLLSQKPA